MYIGLMFISKKLDLENFVSIFLYVSAIFNQVVWNYIIKLKVKTGPARKNEKMKKEAAPASQLLRGQLFKFFLAGLGFIGDKDQNFVYCFNNVVIMIP